MLGGVEDDLRSFELLLYPRFQNHPKNALVPEEVSAMVGFWWVCVFCFCFFSVEGVEVCTSRE